MAEADSMLQRSPASRPDFRIVAELIKPGAKVLDVGCGDGALLSFLQDSRGVDGRGIEISQKGVNECVARGLSVIQGDADSDLVDYPDNAFDYVILSQTLQATFRPRHVVEELLRIGRKAVVSIPNFGNWKVRAALGFGGRMPVTKSLPYEWYDTPNIHFCTVNDFVALCAELRAEIEAAVAINGSGDRMRGPRWAWNLFSQQAVFLLSR